MASKITQFDSGVRTSLVVIAIALVGLLLFGIVGFWVQYGSYLGSSSLGGVDFTVSAEQQEVDSTVPQAVFLTNGQVYFGTLSTITGKVFILDDVYYLQVEGDLQGEEAETDSSLSLIRLGEGEIHEPANRMMVNRDQVLFWENLEADSQVTKAVAAYDSTGSSGPSESGE